MQKRTILTAAAIIAVGLIVVPTAANAANGGSWLLGRSNYESATTNVSNSAGTPLSLIAKSGYAPLKVNSTKTVTNLSADYVDGVTASALARTSAKSAVVWHDGSTDGIGAKCPTGTIVTGGGGYDPMGWEIGYSGPDWNTDTKAVVPNSWIVLDVNWYPLVSFANCVSLTGAAVPGALTNVSSLPTSDVATSAQADELTAQSQGEGVPDVLNDARKKAQDTPKVTKK